MLMKNNFLSKVTKMPQNTGGGNSQTKRATLALPLRYLCAMLFALFMGVGQMWGATITWDLGSKNSTSSDISFGTGSGKTEDFDFTGSDDATHLTYMNYNGGKYIKNNGGLDTNGKSQYNSSKNQRYFTFKAPSSAGTISIKFTSIGGATDGSKEQKIVVYGGTQTTFKTKAIGEWVTSPIISCFQAGTSDVIITLQGDKAVVKEIKWTDAAAPTYTSLYAADFAASMADATVTYSSMSAESSTAWIGWAQSRSGYYATSSSGYATVDFTSDLSLTADSKDAGRIRVYWGHTANGKNLNLTLNALSQVTADTAYYVKVMQVAEYTIPKTVTTLDKIKFSSANNGGLRLYRVEVLTHSGSCSSPTEPEITASPDASYTEGDNISLSATATGTSASTKYTWYKGAEFASATIVQAESTTATYTKNSCTTDDEGTYWCKISNGTSCDVTASLAITVAPTSSPVAPAFTSPATEPDAVTYCVGDEIDALTVVATGTPTPALKWYSNTSKSTEGATELTTGDSYTPSNAAASDKYYYCVATNSAGSATSHYFHVTVRTKPAIAWVNAPANGNVGDADFVASVTTTPGEQTVSWASSVEGAATVTNGTIHYVAPGFTKISAEFTYSGSEYCEEKALIEKEIKVPIISEASGSKDKSWYYTTAVPSSKPDNGLNYASTKEGNGLKGVKLNSDGYAWFAKDAVPGTLRIGAYYSSSSTNAYEVEIYKCSSGGTKGDKIDDLSIPHVGGVSSKLDIDDDVEGIYIKRKTSNEGVLYFVEFIACETAITTQPSGATIEVGDANPELSIVATHAASYAWKESSDGTNYDGSSTLGSSATFTPEVNDAIQTKYYYCEVTSECAGATVVKSDIVTVDVVGAITYYTVTLVPTGGTIDDATGWTLNAGNYEKTVASGTELALPTFTKDNRTFKTWRKAGPADVESPVTVTGDLTLTAVWNATVENVIYSWEGAEGGATEVGGTASSTRNAGTAYTNEEINANTKVHGGTVDYYCLCLSGKADYSDKFVKLALAQNIQAGDKVEVTAFYNKKDDSTGEDKAANARPQMHTMSGTEIFVDPNNLPNLNTSGSPAVRTFTVPSGINTDEVKMTRNQTGSNTWIAKLQIIRETQVEESELLTVTFVYHDGITANTTVEVASGQKVVKPADPTWALHRFNEWQLGGSAYDFSSTVTGNITLDATWTQLYTISFANGGGSGDAPAAIADKAQGETFTVPANTFTAPEGKEFWKWNDGTSDYLPEETYTVGTANVTLTAVWRNPATHYAITYNKGDYGTGTIEAGDKVQDVPFTLSSDRFTRDGYVQTGWAESDGGAKAYDLGGSYTANSAIELFPVWTATYTYEAPFNSGSECSATAPAGWTFANAGTYGASDATAAYICQFGNTCPAPDSIRSDDFVAFAKSNSVYATYDLGITTTVAVVNGIFNVGSSSARTFTIDYLGSDGTTVKHTVTINHPASKNWGRNTVNEKAIVDDVRYIKIKGMTSNMSWIIMQSFSVKYLETRTQYTVSFAAGDGEGTMASKSYIADAVVKAPASTFTAPTDKEFDKWAVTGVGGVTEVEAGGTFTMPAGAVTLTAQWRIPTVKYTVAYYDGASKLGDEEVETGASPVDYADYQTKANYVFVGWYNDPDLAEEHKVTIASEVISDDANYYGKWALDLQVTKIVFSNGFDAFINGNTVKAYYMAGESAPTMTSYEKNANVKDGGVAIVGNKVVLTGTDDSQKEYDLTLEAVTPMTSYDLQTFDGNETYVKAGLAYDGGWKFRKNASDGRISKGYTRLYFFVGGSADRATFTSCADNRKVKIYVNNVETSVTQTASSGNTFDVPLDPAVANNMIAIVSDQTSGDGGVGAMKLNEHVISSDVTLSSLTVNGNAVDLASGSMVAGVMTFNYELPYGTVDAPTVAAVANDAFASLGTITQAASTTGTATFTVTAEDASTLDYAVKFSVSLIPNIVIWDGSTMGAVKTSPDASGLSWASAGISPTSFSAKTCAENGKSYTKALDFGGKTSSSRQFSITVPENYFAKVTLVYRAKGTGNRSIMVSSALSDAVDENTITSVAAVDADNLYIMRADYGEGTLYINTTDGYHVHEISVQLYHVDYTRGVTEGRFGTICLPNGGVMVGAELYEVAYKDPSQNKIFFDQIVNGEMIAGRPYVFLPKKGASQLAVSYTDATDATAGNYHGLYGSYTEEPIADGVGNYILSNNQYREVAAGGEAYVTPNRAYFKYDEIPGTAYTPLPGRKRMSIGAAAPAVTTGMDELNASEAPVKMLIDGQLFILRGEKMYDAKGQLVK